jgi:hypothetical protein
MHIALMDLWLPIVLSAVAVWIAAALAWMVMPHHKGDFRQLTNEDDVMAAVRNLRIPAGLYFFPHMKDCGKMKNDPVATAKFEAGPHGMLQIWPPDAFGKMGRNMILSFIFYVITGVFIAYLGSLALPRGSEFLDAFQITGTAGILAYCFANIPQDIWFGKPLRNMIACLVDGIVFGLLTGAIFGLLWPGPLAA